VVKNYLNDIWEPWQSRMSGIVSLSLTVAATYSTFFAGQQGITHVKVYLWAAAAVLFVFANYQAYAQKARRVVELERLIAERRPKLILGIGATVYRYEPRFDKTMFFLSAELLNQGEPTVTLAWQAQYTMVAHHEAMQSYYLEDPYTVTVGNTSLTVENNDLLNVKTQSEQIEKGGHRGGRLLFTLPGDRTSQIKTCQYRIDVICHDYLFTPSSAGYSPSPVPLGGLQYLPTEKVKLVSTSPARPKIKGET